MKFHPIDPDDSISLFVKNILLFEEDDYTLNTVLPFFADGSLSGANVPFIQSVEENLH